MLLFLTNVQSIKDDFILALASLAKKSACTSIDDVIAYGEVDKLSCEYKSSREFYYPDLQVVILKEQTKSGEIVFLPKVVTTTKATTIAMWEALLFIKTATRL